MKTQPIISAACMVAVLCSPFGALQPLEVRTLRAQTITLEETPSSTDGVEVLPRGPVHEAFAEPVIFDPAPGMVISKKPPEPVEELPPEEKPEGDNIIWIPGYWAWDDDIDDFIWVSGFWRAMPPRRQWVPGYWAEASGGFQWISGFWASAESREVEYLPTPPESLEYGPSTAAPSEGHFWAPGTWQWYETRYVWRPGTWTMAYPNWVWVPSYYNWTPRGCVWVDGYWDYGLANRGLLYAPVRFAPSIYTQVGYAYSPSFAIDVGLLTSHFFVRPSCRHYYYGDYHHTRYLNSGFYPWFSFHSHRHHYDPIYAHHRHHHGQDWDHRLRADYRTHRDHYDRGHSGHAHEFNRDGRGPFNPRYGRDHSIVRSAHDIASRPDSRIRLERIAQSKRDEFKKLGRDTRQLAEQRVSLERIPGRDRSQAKPLPGQRGAPRLQLPRSPIANIDPTPSRRSSGSGSSSERSDRDKSGRDDKSRTKDRPGPSSTPDGLSNRLPQGPRTTPSRTTTPSTENRDRRFPDFGSVPSSRTKVGRPDVDRQGKDRPSTDRLKSDLRGTDLLGTDRPTIDRPNIDRGNTDRSNMERFKDRLNTGRPSFDRPSIDRPDIGRTSVDRTNPERTRVVPPSGERPNPFKREPSSVPKASPTPRIVSPNPTISPSVERPRVDLNRPSNSSREVRRRPDFTSPSTPRTLPDAGGSIQPRPTLRPPSLNPNNIRPESSRRDSISPRAIPNTPRPELTPSRPRPAPTIAPSPTPRIPQLDRSSRLDRPMPEIRNRITPPTSSARPPTPSPAPRIQPRAIQPRPEPRAAPRSAPVPSARIQSSRSNRPEVRVAPTPSPRIPPTAAPGNRDRNDRKR